MILQVDQVWRAHVASQVLIIALLALAQETAPVKRYVLELDQSQIRFSCVYQVKRKTKGFLVLEENSKRSASAHELIDPLWASSDYRCRGAGAGCRGAGAKRL